MVETLDIVGKQVHDTRLVAVCYAHSVTHLLTFNPQHFTSMAAFGPGVTVIEAALV